MTVASPVLGAADIVYTPTGRQSLAWLTDQAGVWRARGERVVTTNGCFDWLHPGHLAFLDLARQQGDRLIVLMNSDESERRIKGPGRPLIGEDDRAAMLLGLRSVDYVVRMEDTLPNGLLEQIRPNVHCKGGDYTPERMPETPVVVAGGGEVRILPLVEGYSTSTLLGKSLNQVQMDGAVDASTAAQTEAVCQALLAGSNVLRQTAYLLAGRLLDVAGWMEDVIRTGHKILVCGNGGSAADAQHFAGELVGRYRRERAGWPALALTVDASVLTSIANDYGFERVFARQVEALGAPGDLLLAISTSGRSPNVVAAIAAARAAGLHTVLLTGAAGVEAGASVDAILAVPSNDTPLIQQAHIALLHVLCDLVEQELAA